jgi:predicted ATP-dependent serine protease
VPAGADGYFLKHVVHDWDEELAHKILRNCRDAMTGQAKLLVVEDLYPDRITSSVRSWRAAANDVNMLVCTGGLQRSDLIIVAARPSMGKTAFSLGLAYGAAIQHGRSVGIFSLEMSADQLVQRLLATETGVDSHRLRLGMIADNEWDRISRAFGRLSEAKIFIDDSPGITLLEMRSAARRLRADGVAAR